MSRHSKDKRKIWEGTDVRLYFMTAEAGDPTLEVTLSTGPEKGRRVLVDIDPHEFLSMAQAMVSEADKADIV